VAKTGSNLLDYNSTLYTKLCVAVVPVSSNIGQYKSVRKGGWDQPSPWAWCFTKISLPEQRRL